MKNATINLRVPADKKSLVENTAKKLNISISEYVLDAIDARTKGCNTAFFESGSVLARCIGELVNYINANRDKFPNEMVNDLKGLVDSTNQAVIESSNIKSRG